MPRKEGAARGTKMGMKNTVITKQIDSELALVCLLVSSTGFSGYPSAEGKESRLPDNSKTLGCLQLQKACRI